MMMILTLLVLPLVFLCLWLGSKVSISMMMFLLLNLSSTVGKFIVPSSLSNLLFKFPPQSSSPQWCHSFSSCEPACLSLVSPQTLLQLILPQLVIFLTVVPRGNVLTELQIKTLWNLYMVFQMEFLLDANTLFVPTIRVRWMSSGRTTSWSLASSSVGWSVIAVSVFFSYTILFSFRSWFPGQISFLEALTHCDHCILSAESSLVLAHEPQELGCYPLLWRQSSCNLLQPDDQLDWRFWRTHGCPSWSCSRA